jgi:hypothetical protein
MAADALVSLAMLMAFACLFYGPWQAVCTDVARQLIFERRDALFDLARAGKLDFASPEYKAIRRMMEGMIRFAHELTWVRLCFVHRVSVRHELPLMSAIDSIKDPATKEKVEALLRECTTVLMATMAAKSVFMAPIVTLLMLYWLWTHTANVFWRRNALVAHLSEMILSGAECQAS